MEPIIQEIEEVIRGKFSEELQKLFTEERDISEFIIATKAMLDGIGARLVAEALGTLEGSKRQRRQKTQLGGKK